MLALSTVMITIVGIASPFEASGLLFKVMLVSTFAVLGYMIDYFAAPYGRPHILLEEMERSVGDEKKLWANGFLVAQIRRAIVIGSVVLAGSIAL